MELKKPAVAGTLESSDAMITIYPQAGKGIDINLESDVKAMFGDSIVESVQDVLSQFQVKDAKVEIQDKGALDCVIRARLECAITRAAEQPYDWSKEDTGHV
jgi:citrate lyase subunit gamma (acyl carrier protein)